MRQAEVSSEAVAKDPKRRRYPINRPPTGGDLTFSWKEGHICTVVLLEVLSQLCHGQLVMGGRWQIAAASDWVCQ